jgi:signal transduction histidine kinase
MNELINGILQYSRIGRVEEEKSEVDLNHLVCDVIDLISPPLNIQIEIQDKLPTVMGEMTRLEQVFQNLISNAVKYMDKPEGKIKIGCTSENRDWQFRVADNGPGIEKKYHDKIFQIFQTLAPRDECESTGIGLTVVKKIVETFGGKIWLESDLGAGSTFYFTLPKN